MAMAMGPSMLEDKYPDQVHLRNIIQLGKLPISDFGLIFNSGIILQVELIYFGQVQV